MVSQSTCSVRYNPKKLRNSSVDISRGSKIREPVSRHLWYAGHCITCWCSATSRLRFLPNISLAKIFNLSMAPESPPRFYRVNFSVARMARIILEFSIARTHHTILKHVMPKSERAGFECRFLKGLGRASRASIPRIRVASAPRRTSKVLARSEKQSRRMKFGINFNH